MAAVYGAMEVLPVDELRQKLNENSAWFRKFQDSLYNDKAVADLMAQSSLSGNAQTANPGWYTAGNIAGNTAAAMAGGAALSAAGATSAAAGDAIVSGLLGGTHSAVKQDWSKPGQAVFNTVLDAGANAALAYGGGKLVNKLDDLIRNNWYGTGKSATAADTKWPETPEELFANNSGISYTKDAGKTAKAGEPDNLDNAIEDWHGDRVTGDLATEGTGDFEIPKPPKPASLSDTETRQWYLDAEAKIPHLIDSTKPLEQQAKQAFELRNQFRMQARAAMSNRTTAQSLEITDPNQTWEQLFEKYTAKGFTGDALYQEIIKASTRSRTSINKTLGIFPK